MRRPATQRVPASGNAAPDHPSPNALQLVSNPEISNPPATPIVPDSHAEVTTLLVALAHGEPEAMDRLLPAIYDELKRLASAQLRRERDEHTLGATALVHEAYLRLVDQRAVNWQGRAHFFGIAAQSMRRILVDHARRRSASKRARDHQVTLDTAVAIASDSNSDEILAVHEALERLAEFDPRQAQLVELRYFAGFTIEEAADLLGISTATASRDWTVARAWLQRELAPNA
ncbi:MAG: sigma-70 family RNA polymerase sigma factor [Gemmatimonadaceae bacterium]|nr:sigma-70 family RNA polymerase sigma factor [Gemmatimonadaceae bacterium]